MISQISKTQFLKDLLSIETPSAVTDERLRILAKSSPLFNRGIITYDGLSSYQLLIGDKLYPLCRTVITLDGERLFVFTLLYEADLSVLFNEPFYERACRTYSGRLRTCAAEYLSIIPKGEDGCPSALEYKVKTTNLKMLSGFANCELMTHLSSSRLITAYDLADELYEYIENIETISKANSLSFSSHIDRSVITDVDPALIRCVISNLLVNSFAYNKGDDKRASLSVTRSGRRIFVTVCDNAGGIDDKTLNNTNIPFYDHGNCGEGLGLYIARHFAQDHGGGLMLENKDGGLCAELSFTLRKEREIPISSPSTPFYHTLLEPEYIILAKAMKILL